MSEGERLLLGMFKLSLAILGILIIGLVIEVSGIFDTEEERYEKQIHMEAWKRLRDVELIKSQTRWNNMVQQLKKEKPFKGDPMPDLQTEPDVPKCIVYDGDPE